MLISKKYLEEILNQEIENKKLPLSIIKIEEGEEIYRVTICGGNNGHRNWSQYLCQIGQVMDSVFDCWLISLNNDVLDDIWYLELGFKKV